MAIGLLVGRERGWQERDAPDRSRTAGIPTFGISGLLCGVLAALAANALGRLLLAVSAGPARFWPPLALATLIAMALASGAMVWMSP
ncbi:hypothetical protein FJW08_29780 [Mesorhizobium sp. B3-2-1]|uniref:hypothetical protein n=1 Tax=Mesorhizobium sp. B3-2-1 TaxID=2589891 RepID=UPI00112975CB|nr:hypothetical protein [Mesorhizobium sp. B3-2-1]TPI24305.1 hypothetical protein FJW08_29780 [Mesorhizobium sp. B3-2-1]